MAVIAAVMKRFRWQLYAYCLLDNHYHLLLETPEPNLSRGMRQLNGVYTQCFNRRHGHIGHVFQGRFKAILVEEESYLLELARYVVLNPTRVKPPHEYQNYRWSSYRATAGLEPSPPWLCAESLLGRFGAVRATAQRRYAAFVHAGVGLPTVWDDLKQQIYLGTDAFVAQLQKRILNSPSLSEVPRIQRRPPVKPLDAFASSHEDATAAMVAAYRSGQYSLAAIGRFFGVHYSTVSRAVKAAEDRNVEQ